MKSITDTLTQFTAAVDDLLDRLGGR